MLKLQDELMKLWTDKRYSEEFRKSPSRYKDFQHALLHVMKAAGKLTVMVEEADHGVKDVLFFPKEGVKKYLADIIICAVRMANVAPTGSVDIEEAVLDRIEEKMGVRLMHESEQR